MGDVNLTNVRKQYDDVVAVEGMDLTIEDGEFVTLVGPSGCGKSTTLETIAGLTTPTSGTIEIDGVDVTRKPPKDRDIAMVFQNIALFPHMTVYENISFGLRLRNYDKEEIDRRVQEAVEIVQLEGMLDRSPDELSGGQQQRVGIARAIVREPEVFLMDEPLANLDAKLRVSMRTEIQRLQKELGVTSIYVTHDQEEAMTMSDRIAIINDGELQQCSPPLVCYNQPANTFVAQFIGSPSMNMFDGRVSGNSLDVGEFDVGFDPGTIGLQDGDSVTVGVRPEDIYLAEDAGALAHPSTPVTVNVDVLEPVGDQTYAYLLIGEGDDAKELLMSAAPDKTLEAGETVDVVFARDNIHVFEGTTGDAVAHSLVGSATSGGETTVGGEV
ncbi:ABC transporter ATP-binding protein [Halopelagius longus]|uniref:ABC-type D-xylose/L-arabinose transporter n=1 Tax=Halopelagius longus TaxID=1236180 RepID=A0A1H1G2N5_9EURY|nr:ABC transporter ATP-binding protein [Halopelagius longus]RDI69880.1 ABC transporter ATP-binding protein [Halopelagius longus]SDR07484.1 carbohydrate ABC transporter ATP-binding protein, CUT1 family [Halopelagius longus]